MGVRMGEDGKGGDGMLGEISDALSHWTIPNQRPTVRQLPVTCSKQPTDTLQRFPASNPLQNAPC